MREYQLLHVVITSFVLIIFSSTDTSAGAESGEFFGYKIGDNYPINSNTSVKKKSSISDGRVSSNILEIVTENPIKPKEIQEVRVSTTVQTFTIIDIFAYNKFDFGLILPFLFQF